MKLKSVFRISFLLMAMALGSLSYAAEPVWIDVRSAVEHAIDNIEGDVRISHRDIVQEVTILFPDKSTEIYLYCQSGGRSDTAMAALEDAGYTHVINAGGIDDARKERGLSQ